MLITIFFRINNGNFVKDYKKRTSFWGNFREQSQEEYFYLVIPIPCLMYHMTISYPSFLFYFNTYCMSCIWFYIFFFILYLSYFSMYFIQIYFVLRGVNTLLENLFYVSLHCFWIDLIIYIIVKSFVTQLVSTFWYFQQKNSRFKFLNPNYTYYMLSFIDIFFAFGN